MDPSHPRLIAFQEAGPPTLATEHAPPAISLRAEHVFDIGPATITNSLILSTIVMVVFVIFALILRRTFTIIPNAIQNAIESMIEGCLALLEPILGSRERAERYFPLIASIFAFVAVSNWAGLLPGVGSLLVSYDGHSVPLLRAPGADLNFTLAVAVIAVIATHFFGIAAIGTAAHAKRFFNFKNPILFGVGILELVAEFARMISFSFRLFGNIFAGEVLLIIAAFLAPYFVPLPFLVMELFVGFIQAFIFAMLTTVFIATATTPHAEPAGRKAPA
jgi:F-type H+-transporting ATPase subunit a